MQISVLPDSSVEVVAPCFCRRERYCDEDAQARWLDTQADAVLSAISAAPDRRFVAGETHLYLGRRYRLKIVRGEQSAIKLKRGVIEVHTRFPSRKAAIR